MLHYTFTCSATYRINYTQAWMFQFLSAKNFLYTSEKSEEVSSIYVTTGNITLGKMC